MAQNIFEQILAEQGGGKKKKEEAAPAATSTTVLEAPPPAGTNIFDEIAAEGSNGQGVSAEIRSRNAARRAEWERNMSPLERAKWRASRLFGNIGTAAGNMAEGISQLPGRVLDVATAGRNAPQRPGVLGGLENIFWDTPIAQYEAGKNLVSDVAGGMKHAVWDVPYAAGQELGRTLTGQSEGVSPETTAGFITETIPAIVGFKGAREPISTAVPKGIAGARDLAAAGVSRLPGGAGAAESIRPRSPVQTHYNLNNLATISRTAGPEIVDVHPLVQRWFNEYGLTADDIATLNRAIETDPIGDVYRGLSKEKFDRLAKELGQEPGKTAPLPIELAKGIVDMADQPFRAAMKEYGKLPTTEVQLQIEGSLRQLAKDTLDDGLRRTYEQLADKVKAEGGTAGGLMEIKQWANKEGTRLFDMSPGQRIDAGARPIAAYGDVTGLIRSKLYPVIERASQGTLDLAEAGRVESQAIAFRNGVWKEWDRTATEHAAAARKAGGYAASPSKFKRFITQPGNITRAAAGLLTGRGPGSLAAGVAPSVTGLTLPLEQFNKILKAGVGPMEGYRPPAALQTGPGYKPPATQLDLIPHDPNLPLLEPPPGQASGIGQEIFGVQQRANQAARRAPPETLAGTQVDLASGTVTPGPGPAQGSLLAEQGVVHPQGPGAAADYATQLRRNAITREMEATLPQPPKGQLTLETQAPLPAGPGATPPDLFGVRAPAGNPVPPGTRLQFVSKMRDGTTKYHYVLPNGTTFVLDWEIPITEVNKPPLAPPPQ